MSTDTVRSLERPQMQHISLSIVAEGETPGQKLDSLLQQLSAMIDGDATVRLAVSIVNDQLLLKWSEEFSTLTTSESPAAAANIASRLTDPSQVEMFRSWLGADVFEAWCSDRPQDMPIRSVFASDGEGLTPKMRATLSRIAQILERHHYDSVADLIGKRKVIKRLTGIGPAYLAIIGEKMDALGYDFEG